MPRPTTSSRPKPGAKPADHLPPASAALQAEALAERPAGADLLVPPGHLRAGDRARLLTLATSFQGKSSELEDGKYEVGLALIAKVDKLLEKKFAVDPKAYATWATADGGGPDVETRIVELFSWYAARLGE